MAKTKLDIDFAAISYRDIDDAISRLSKEKQNRLRVNNKKLVNSVKDLKRDTKSVIKLITPEKRAYVKIEVPVYVGVNIEEGFIQGSIRLENDYHSLHDYIYDQNVDELVESHGINLKALKDKVELLKSAVHDRAILLDVDEDNIWAIIDPDAILSYYEY